MKLFQLALSLAKGKQLAKILNRIQILTLYYNF